MKDLVQVSDSGTAKLRNNDGETVDSREWGDEKSVVEVKGWVRVLLRERGKIVPGSIRESKNIWTNSGREFLAMLMSLQSPGVKFREDSVAYIGVGIGSQIEDANVTRLLTPTEFVAGTFLAALDVPPTFPLTPTRTTVRYKRTFTESEITLSPGGVNVSEIGLFTNGSPGASPPYNPGTRDVTFANAALQAPIAYKTFEPVRKTDVLQLEIDWEIRF